MTNTINQDLIDDAKASGLYLALDVAWIVLGKHIEPLAKFAQLQRERQAQPTQPQTVKDALEQAAEVCHTLIRISCKNEATANVMRIARDNIFALIQTEKGEL